MKDLSIDINNVLRYIGTNPAKAEDKLFLQIEDCITAIRQAAQPRWITAEHPLSRSSGLLCANMPISGRQIAKHLERCDGCVLFAATLGAGIDTLIRRTMLSDIGRALILDSCASEAIENLCDQIEADLRCALEAKGLYLSGRFSPGYGDFPLDTQAELCRILDTSRKIGLTVTDSCILVPQKSVTAVLGISACATEKKQSKCDTCPMANGCAYRKE